MADGGATPTRTRPPARVPPHNLQAEESLLGAMLLSRDAIADAVDVLSASGAGAFYKPAHGHIYDAITTLWAAGHPSDPVTVANALRTADLLDAIGGPHALTDLVATTPFTSHADRYAEIVDERHRLRQLIGVGSEIVELGHSMSDDVAATVDQAEQLLFAISNADRRRAAMHFGSGLDSWLDRLIAARQSGQLPGILTGLHDLDAILLGLQPGQLVVGAGRPGMGKTVFGTTIARAAARAGYPTLLVTLEMFADEMTSRLVAADAKVPLEHLRAAMRLTPKDFERIAFVMEEWRDLPLMIDDDATSNLMSIRASARRMASRFGAVGLVVVDYVQLIAALKDHRGRREGEVAEVARGLKKLAGELACPVLALAQLNRDVEGRADKRPTLGDLRESGEIENASDVVVLLYRDDYYNPQSKDRGIIELNVAKHRNGKTGKVKAHWMAAYGEIATMRSAGYEPPAGGDELLYGEAMS